MNDIPDHADIPAHADAAADNDATGNDATGNDAADNDAADNDAADNDATGDVAAGDAHEHPYELIPGRADSVVFLTCEHASERLPAPWRLSEPDARLFGTHWAYDLGAAEITRELARALDAPAVLAHFSRLLVDPNRPEDAATLFRDMADAQAIELNRGIDADERELRVRTLYRPFHDAVDRHLRQTSHAIVFAVHSFTALYEGTPRVMEIGVLFDRESELAEKMAQALRRAGLVVAMNQPYSGKEGLMYSAERHADNHGRRAIEIEVRQDLATDTSHRHRVVHALAEFFRGLDHGPGRES